jgi:outer membrane protein assembly factor BamD (BamD/ComL family)
MENDVPTANNVDPKNKLSLLLKVKSKVKNKRRLAYIIVSVVVIAAVAIAVVVVQANKGNTNKASTTSSKAAADDLKKQAEKALKDNNVSKAKELFEQAEAQYKALNDTPSSIDVEAQLYIINHRYSSK